MSDEAGSSMSGESDAKARFREALETKKRNGGKPSNKISRKQKITGDQASERISKFFRRKTGQG